MKTLRRIASILILILALTSSAASAQDSIAAPKREGSAWTLEGPLGLHKRAEIDTLLYNYQRRSIPAMVTDAYATTGNTGAEGIDMIFSRRHEPTEYYFDGPLQAWTTTLDNQKLYNVYTPMTLLSWNFGGNKNSRTDRLNAQFAGNVNRKIGVSAFLDYIYSKGSYESQATKDFAWGGAMYYLGDRYELQAMYNQMNFLNKENGGITDDLYITDPAEVQAGVSKIEAKSIPTRLTAAHNRIRGRQAFMTHAYKVGFWDTEQVNDTLTRDVYVPLMRFIYSFKYVDRKRFFLNTNPQQARDFWQNTYFNPERTDESFNYWAISNSLGVELIEGFKKWAKFGISAYATYEVRRFSQPTALGMPLPETPPEEGVLTPLPDGFHVAPQETQSLVWVGGRLDRKSGTILNYAADVKFGLVGDAAGEIDLKGDVSSRFKLFGDTVAIAARGRFSNLTPDYFMRRYVSNHFVWNNDFGKIRSFQVGGELTIPWTRTTLSVDFQNRQNYVFFNSQCLPEQYGGSVQVFTARLDQRLHFGVWNWNNTVTYQASSNTDVIPLPALAVYSNMYLAFKAFRVLDLQIGVDCDYYTKYKGLNYQPATMAFHVQDKETAVDVGNFALMNAYITAKLYKVRFYVLWSHFNQGWFSKSYFSMPHYPIDPRRLQFGLCVDFAD